MNKYFNTKVFQEIVMVFENRIGDFESDICAILAQLTHHIHPKILERIQARNIEEYSYYEQLFGDRIEIQNYLFDGSACVFPGVRRYVSRRGNLRAYNEEYRAIIDDNIFPRHIWSFLESGNAYSGPNWKSTGLSEFELAHVFTHKETELDFERRLFKNTDPNLLPYSCFSCSGNVVLLPKGTVRPTDNSESIKAAFFQRFIELYGEGPLGGRSEFEQSKIPHWASSLRWNEPVLPNNWETNVGRLLEYRTNRITHLMS
jgi:hypothetical protein